MVEGRSQGQRYDVATTGERVTLLRSHLGLTKVELSELIGVDPSSITKIEKGLKPILPPAAALLADATGATLDYIYLGDVSNVPYRLATRIREMEGDLLRRAGRRSGRSGRD